MVSLANKKRGEQLTTQIKHNFKNISRTRYWIRLNYYAPTNGYNFFFQQWQPHTLSRSWPIGDFRNCSFEDLIEILTVLRQNYQFTIETAHISKKQLQELHSKRLI